MLNRVTGSLRNNVPKYPILILYNTENIKYVVLILRGLVEFQVVMWPNFGKIKLRHANFPVIHGLLFIDQVTQTSY